MNNWEAIKASLYADDSVTRSRRNEIWRWTTAVRSWLDANGIDILTVGPGDMGRFVAEVPPSSGPTNPYQRKSAFRQLVKAAAAVIPAPARRSGTAAALVDQVPARSPLGKAIARVLACSKSEGDRRRWATCLGAFLRWCDDRGVAATDCWPGDLVVYRRDRLAAGYASPGEYLRVARRLLAELSTCR